MVLAGVAALTGVVLVAWLVRDASERRALHAEMEQLRTDVALLRVESHACQSEVAWEEADFQAYHGQVDSLRQEVRDLESRDPRGVPAEHYDDYLEVFARYNRSIPDWRERAEALQSMWEACRDVTERHNELADSLRRRVAALAG
jgi:uncharacterized protein YukE